MKFEDAFAPTEEELSVWASDPDAKFPEEMSQDWDLILADIRYGPILIKLASENNPNRLFFLSCLYTLSGDCIRVEVNEVAVDAIRGLFELIPENAPDDLHLWATRSERLFSDPSLYNYDDWGWGLLAHHNEV